jgi:hypothetical protein
MPKLTPEELLRSIAEFPDDASMDEDVEAVLAMTPEEIEAELVAAGYTRAELDADADELLGPAPKTNATGTPAATPGPTADATDGMTRPGRRARHLPPSLRRSCPSRAGAGSRAGSFSSLSQLPLLSSPWKSLRLSLGGLARTCA